MNRCDQLADALAELRGAYTCTEIPDDRSLLVNTGRYFADGQAVEVVVRLLDGEVIVGDAGLVAGRLELSGVGTQSGRSGDLWRDIAKDFGVSETDGRLYVRGQTKRSADLISQLADAALSLDVTRHVSTAGRRQRFEREVRDWLTADAGVRVLEERAVPTRTGGEQRVTALVQAKSRKVAILAVSGGGASQRTRAIEHAYFVFSQISQDWRADQRLTVLGGPDNGWSRQDHLRSLRETCFVGSFARQLPLARFLDGELAPADHDLMPPPSGTQLMIN